MAQTPMQRMQQCRIGNRQHSNWRLAPGFPRLTCSGHSCGLDASPADAAVLPASISTDPCTDLGLQLSLTWVTDCWYVLVAVFLV